MAEKLITPYTQGRIKTEPVSVAQKQERQMKNSVIKMPRSIHCRMGMMYRYSTFTRMILKTMLNAVITCTATVTNKIVRKFVEYRDVRLTGREAVMFAEREVYI